MRGLVVGIAIAVTVTASACGRGGAPFAPLQTRLALAEQLWTARGPASYDLTITRSCECTPEMTGPVVVEVRDHVVRSRRYVASGDTVPAALAGEFRSVEETFAFIQELVGRNPARLDVTYDPEDGIPLVVSVDYDAQTVDDEIVYRVQTLVAR